MSGTNTVETIALTGAQFDAGTYSVSGSWVETFNSAGTLIAVSNDALTVSQTGITGAETIAVDQAGTTGSTPIQHNDPGSGLPYYEIDFTTLTGGTNLNLTHVYIDFASETASPAPLGTSTGAGEYSSLKTGGGGVYETSDAGTLTILHSNAAFTFTGSLGSDFEAGGNFSGGTAPGDNIVPGESVTIASDAVNPASVTASSVIDNGSIAVGGSFIDSGALTGAGTLAVLAGGTASLGGSVSLAAILDSGTILLTSAQALSAINMEGNGAHSVVDFSGTNSATPLTNFGTTDDIILGPAALASPTAGSGIALSYNTSAGVLTVETTNASTGSIINTAHVTVSGVGGTSLSTASFVALESTAGVNIELASSLSGSSFTFTGASDTRFENPADFSGGVAPGDQLAAGETVAIAAGTASVTGGGVTDNGFITVTSTFIDTGTLTGTGTLAIATGGHATLGGGATLGSISDAGTLDLLGALLAPVNLQGNTAHSLIDFSGADLTGTTLKTSLTSFGKTDQIILGTSNFSLSGAADNLTQTYNSTTDRLVIDDTTSGAVVTLNLALASGDTGASISLSTAGGVLDISIPCYAAGTHILSPAGEVLVEDLRVGDSVVTVRAGGPLCRKIIWTGRRRIDIARHPEPEIVRPVRITAGAIAPGVPERDLRLSPQHAVAIDGALFEALALVNSVTIFQERGTAAVTYHHIELEAHDIMLAEGLAAESFLNAGNRGSFENQEAPLVLHADFRTADAGGFCLPLHRDGAVLAGVQHRLRERALEHALERAEEHAEEHALQRAGAAAA